MNTMKYRNVKCLDDIVHNKKVDEFLEMSKNAPDPIVVPDTCERDQMAILIDKVIRIHYWVKWAGLVYLVLPFLLAVISVVFMLIALSRGADL